MAKCQPIRAHINIPSKDFFFSREVVKVKETGTLKGTLLLSKLFCIISVCKGSSLKVNDLLLFFL